MLQFFRVIALIEGVTTIALFLVAMPLKYAFDNPALVPPVGMTHGVAWLAYVVAMAICLPGAGLSAWEWLPRSSPRCSRSGPSSTTTS